MRARSTLLAAAIALAWSPVTAQGSPADANPVPDTLEMRVSRLENMVEADQARRQAEQEDKDPNRVELFWDQGLKLEGAQGAVRLQLGAWVLNDWGFFVVDESLKSYQPPVFHRDTGEQLPAIGNSSNSVELRAVRLRLGGELFEQFGFMFDVDFAGGDPTLRDVYLRLEQLPNLEFLGQLQAGNFFEPFGLEQQTLLRDIPLMEKSPASALTPERNIGVMLHDSVFDSQATWAAGVFRNSDDFGSGSGSDNWALTGRLTGLPWLDEEDGHHRLVHIGGAYSYRRPEDNLSRFMSRPSSHLAQVLVDTGRQSLREEHRAGLEGAIVWDSCSLQAEYFYVRGQGTGGGPNMNLHGFYVMGAYLITGETRQYDRARGYFRGVTPNLGLFAGGWGAWEAVLRYSYLDLDTFTIQGGVLHDTSAGVNWYLNSAFRVAFNYVWSHLESVDDMHTLQCRFQVAF